MDTEFGFKLNNLKEQVRYKYQNLKKNNQETKEDMNIF